MEEEKKKQDYKDEKEEEEEKRKNNKKNIFEMRIKVIRKKNINKIRVIKNKNHTAKP